MDHQLARQQLDRLISTSGTSYAAISRMLSRNDAYIQQYIKRGTPVRLEAGDRRLLAQHFGVTEAVLLGERQLATPERNGLLKIPQLDVLASAGPGASDGTEVELGHYGFDRRWLRQISRGKPEDLSIVSVQGDSMAPTLMDGDDILVDRVDGGARLRDGIYVLQRDDTLLVKRLALSPATGRLTIASDNPAYPTWTDCSPDEVRVVGRVVWSGRRLG